MSTSQPVSDEADIVYPDTDGQPVAENTLQFDWITLLKGGIETLLREDPQVFVAGDLLWYPVRGNPQLRVAPDTMVAFGRPKGHRGSYRQWDEGGVAPQVVFEVLSPGNREREMAEKFAFYERYGVDEYYILDPDAETWTGWLRSAATGRLEPIAVMQGWISPRLQIRFEADPELRVLSPTEEPLVSYVDLARQRDAAVAERDRIARQKNRVTRERDRLAEERDRLAEERDRLARRLRELGIDPNSLGEPER